MSDFGTIVEEWLDPESHSVWERNPATKIFSLVRYCNKQVDGLWVVNDYAKALNCGRSSSQADGATVSNPVAFPPEFKFSPNTGNPITKTVLKIRTWLPVSGSEELKSGMLRGGCLTAHPLKLKEDSLLANGPEYELPLPGRGHYRFCVGAFGLSSTFLLALDAEKGVIHCWLPSRGEWSELSATPESPYLGTESFAQGVWNIEVRDLTVESILFWPSDHGLVAIKVDVLSLSYEARVLVEGCCLSVPRIIKNKVYIIIKNSDGNICAVSVDSDWYSGNKSFDVVLNDIPLASWDMAVATSREVIWLSDTGQVVLRPIAQQYFFIPWEAGVEPQFRLGGPHCSADGHLWMQVLHPTIHEGERGFCYIQLGRKNPEIQPSVGARTLTGGSSIKVEKWLKEDPWIEPTVVVTNDHENDEAVIPILESICDRTLLVLRVDHLPGVTQLFERTGEIFSTRFQIMGQHGDGGFYVKRLREPWTASAFIFEEVIFIYHPDIGSIPGWPTVSTECE